MSNPQVSPPIYSIVEQIIVYTKRTCEHVAILLTSAKKANLIPVHGVLIKVLRYVSSGRTSKEHYRCDNCYSAAISVIELEFLRDIISYVRGKEH